ncbi:MAG: zinc finger domain-containing protein, partial [Thermoanaerobaculia bacterium]
GIGNVYKSETLFIGGVNPFTKVESLTDATLERLVTIGREILQRNVSPDTRERRTTRFLNPKEALWVYGRRGQPCRKCGTAIESKRQGADARLTFWCPRCQVL